MMTRYEKLLDRVHESGIRFERTKDALLPAVSMPMHEHGAIFFDEKGFESDAERLVALAHDKGHCDAGAFYTLSTPYETKGRCEQKAWKRAVAELIPFDVLMDAFDACRTAEGVSVHDLAEHLGVTPDFVVRAVEQYERWGNQIL